MTIQPPSSWSEISSNGAKNSISIANLLKKLTSVTTQTDILQAAVEITHKTLKCDRVVVYSMQSATMCQITAEAVTPGYAQILGTTIEDPCFETRYIDKYQRGRVKANSNIREAGMSLCYVENLEKIDVKANLVVPLTFPDNSLYGLLVMHQCSNTRVWQQTEIDFALSIANWTIKQVFQEKDLSQLQDHIKRQEKRQELLTSIVREIHGATTSETVLQMAVDKAKETLQCDRVVVYCLQSGNMGEIVAEATMPALASILATVIKDPCFEYRYLESYQNGRIRAIDNIYHGGMTSCYVDNLAKIGVKSNLVAPINWDNGKIYGLLVAHQCFEFKAWQQDEIDNFQQIAFHTGLSLSKAKLKEESKIVEMGLGKLKDLKNGLEEVETKMEQIDLPIQNTSKILVEANNLNKLLAREINSLANSGSGETKKNLKLITIITKKLIVIASKLNESLFTVKEHNQEAKKALELAVQDLQENPPRNV